MNTVFKTDVEFTTDYIKESDFITVAVGEHETRCIVDVCYRVVGRKAKFFVISHGLALFTGWIDESNIVSIEQRKADRDETNYIS